jgi:hypothetical protein
MAVAGCLFSLVEIRLEPVIIRLHIISDVHLEAGWPIWILMCWLPLAISMSVYGVSNGSSPRPDGLLDVF